MLEDELETQTNLAVVNGKRAEVAENKLEETERYLYYMYIIYL